MNTGMWISVMAVWMVVAYLLGRLREQTVSNHRWRERMPRVFANGVAFGVSVGRGMDQGRDAGFTGSTGPIREIADALARHNPTEPT